MRSSLVGFTDYSNQLLEEILKDYKELFIYSKKISHKKSNIQKLNIRIDLGDIFIETVLFSERFIEFYKTSAKRIKDKQVDRFTIQELKLLGANARSLNRDIGKIWHDCDYFDDSQLSDYYREFRNYAASMLDLGVIGEELESRFIKDGKNIYRNYSQKSVFKEVYKEIKEWAKIVSQYFHK